MNLRRLDLPDLETRVKWMNDKRVFDLMHFEVPVKIEDTIKWFQRISLDDNRADLVIEDDDRLLAMAGITNINKILRTGELYIFVNPDLQKQGIGNKSIKLICNYGFNQLKLNKIYLYTNANNIGARKIYENNGFKLEGVLRQEALYQGKLIDRLYFGILAGDN